MNNKKLCHFLLLKEILPHPLLLTSTAGNFCSSDNNLSCDNIEFAAIISDLLENGTPVSAS